MDPSFQTVSAYCQDDFHQRMADFATLADALDYAAVAGTGMNFYGVNGNVAHSLTYAGIRERSLNLAHKIMALGLKRGDRVGMIADMHPDFVCLFFACQYAGLLAVPLPAVTVLGGREGYQKQLVRILETSGAAAAFCIPESFTHLESAVKFLSRDVIVMDTAELSSKENAFSDLQPFTAGETSHIQYSSGSTRHPLGIEISQKALMNNARSIACHGVGFQAKERIASWLPYYHDMGLIGCLIVPVTCQLTVDYLFTDAFARRPLQWLKMISDHRCTVSFSPTFGYDLCARRATGKADLGLDLSCWRYAGIGGDMIQPDVFARFAETFAASGFRAQALTASYGLAEATLAFSFAEPARGIVKDIVDKEAASHENIARPLNRPEALPSHTARHFASCGKPMPGYELEIRDDAGAALSDRHIGGVFIRCESLMSGYYLEPEATSSCMPGDGWLNTGDMGYVVNGDLFVTGRKKDMIIVNGKNIWPQDIEWHAENNVGALRSRDTAAFAYENEDGHEIPVILVQCRATASEERDAIRKEVHAAVFRNTGIDCRVELIPQRSLPFTTSGKLSRTKAKKAWLKGAYALDDARKPDALYAAA